MIRAELKDKVAKELGITARKADRIILSVVGAIHKGIKRDGKVVIKHFGCFRMKDMKPFKYHKPGTGEYGMTEPHKKISFKAGKGLAELVNGL